MIRLCDHRLSGFDTNTRAMLTEVWLALLLVAFKERMYIKIMTKGVLTQLYSCKILTLL